jgi:hypothetical protein
MLTGCEDGPNVPSYPAIKFNHLETFNLNVASIDVVDRYEPPMGSPNVDHLFPLSLSSAVETWAKDRLNATGSAYKLKVVIHDASVTSKTLPKSEKGIKGFFTKEQGELFNARLEVTFEVFEDDPLIPKNEMRIEISKSKSIEEGATLNEKEALFYQITKEIINDFNAQFEKNFDTYLGQIRL